MDKVKSLRFRPIGMGMGNLIINSPQFDEQVRMARLVEAGAFNRVPVAIDFVFKPREVGKKSEVRSK